MIEHYIRGFEEELREIRHQIHENPELGLQEFKTSALVAEKLFSVRHVSEQLADREKPGLLRCSRAHKAPPSTQASAATLAAVRPRPSESTGFRRQQAALRVQGRSLTAEASFKKRYGINLYEVLF